MRILLAILLLLVAERAAAQIDFGSGNHMLPHCKAAIARNDLTVFSGQCGGVIDALIFTGSSIEGSGRFCPPPIPPVQGLRVVVLYLERHPALLHLDFKVLALRALQEAWPCSN
jgi:hypothetical protein